jgi:hypothetical protein
MNKKIIDLIEKGKKEFKDCSTNEEFYYSAFHFYLENMPDKVTHLEDVELEMYCCNMLDKIERNAYLYVKMDRTMFYRNYVLWREKNDF